MLQDFTSQKRNCRALLPPKMYLIKDKIKIGSIAPLAQNGMFHSVHAYTTIWFIFIGGMHSSQCQHQPKGRGSPAAAQGQNPRENDIWWSYQSNRAARQNWYAYSPCMFHGAWEIHSSNVIKLRRMRHWRLILLKQLSVGSGKNALTVMRWCSALQAVPIFIADAGCHSGMPLIPSNKHHIRG